MLTRRALLSSVAAAGLGSVLAACTRGSSPAPSASGSATRPSGPGLQAGRSREQLLAADSFSMVNFPDGHVTYQPVDGGYRVWLSSGVDGSGGSTVALDSPDLVEFTPAQLADGKAVIGLAPVGGQVAFDSDYCAPGSVFPSADGSRLWLVYHSENHTFAGVTNVGSPFYATIGLASSTDGGLTWDRQGAVITGQVPRDDGPAPRDVVGAGSPSAVVVDDLVYVVYLDWNLAGPDQLHLARAPLASVDDPTAWVKWHEGSFSTPGSGGDSTAVVTRPGDGDETVFAGGASLSWNTELQRYLLVFQSADGFWWTHSADLTGWAESQRFLPNDAPALDGARFVAYGSLLTPGEDTDQVTGRESYLYLATTGEDEDSHSLWRIPVTVTA
ncbi:protein of unknown function [Klenkia soli]|uniref:Glycosyl hydrolases family 43 n=1 Tax=Klenkia soli TaxID=1052260 RepID=A0A1H0UU09_9ACTN|nr:DUF4185 domain-containing protein [Klenkia soli]SDP69707.1 protein of unknown function [Klenkia soli]